MNKMIARSDLRNDAAIFFMLRHLRSDFAHKQLPIP